MLIPCETWDLPGEVAACSDTCETLPYEPHAPPAEYGYGVVEIEDCLEVLCFNSNMPTKFLNKLVPFIIYQSNCHCCCRILLRSPSQRPRRIARFQPTSLRHQRQLRPLQILEPTVTWICWTQRQEFFTPSTPPTLTWIIKRNK